MATFREFVCDTPGSESKRAAYRVVHDALCASIFRELGGRLVDWPPANARRLAAAEPAEQGEFLQAWLDEIPLAWRNVRAQLCALAQGDATLRRRSGHLAWVLIATQLSALSPTTLQGALRAIPDARLAALYGGGSAHLPMLHYVARYELQTRLNNATAVTKSVTREIQDRAELGLMPEPALLKALAASLRRRAAMEQALSGNACYPLVAKAVEVISGSAEGTGLNAELQALLDVLLRLAGSNASMAQEDDTGSVAALVTLADPHLAPHAPGCYRAALAIRQFVDFARSWMAPVFIDSHGRALRLTSLLSVRAARVDDSLGATSPQVQLVASVGVRGDHPPITLIVVAQLGENDAVLGLADHAQLRNARPIGKLGKFTAVV